jgi:hypothetical protein
LHSGLGNAFFIVDVQRSDAPAVPPQTVIERLTANFLGDNSRVTVGTDNSVNIANKVEPLEVTRLLEQIKPHINSLPEPQRTEIAKPLKLLEDEIENGSPNPSRLRGALRSMLTVVEGTTGNLIAAGIVSLIVKILGS